MRDRSVFDVYADCSHVSGQRSFTMDVQPVGGYDIANKRALHNNFTRSNCGSDLPIAANSYAIARKVDRSFDLAVNVK